ncbi:hypothetical protein DRJ24_02980 [Candidatus Acetothermia bacterium]|nr:MAG: hypothetical protein DRJ24_02980 [Candidatus Acetothermia bacterium]HHK67212.1 hypothetical protein [Candidatus Acetothermia bacterium]
MESQRDENVLDAVMLEGLALLAAVNDRTIEEELNRAVETYLRQELPLPSGLSDLADHLLDKTQTK